MSLAAVAAAASTPLFAQANQPIEAKGPVSMVVGAAQATNVLATGTAVELKLVQELTTEGKLLHVGDRFKMEVAAPVLLNGQTVIPTGANAVGEITAIRNKGMWGKSGSIDGRALYVTANGRQIRLSGNLYDKGRKSGAGAVAVSAIVFAPAGFFMTGTSARLPIGTIVHAQSDEDVQVAFAPAAAPTQMMGTVATPAAGSPTVMAAVAAPK